MKKFGYLWKMIILAILFAIVFWGIMFFKKQKSENDLNNDTDNTPNNVVSSVLVGKNLSILGDSISTYWGYSNNGEHNTTITKNNVYYGADNTSTLKDVSETWWQQTATKYGMNVLVNNSAGGSCTLSNNSDDTRLSGLSRCTNLHQDTAVPAVNPDIIAVFMGTNDFLSYVDVGTYSESLYTSLIEGNGKGQYYYSPPRNFTEAYIVMIHRMMNKYKDADIFCFTLPEGAVLNGQWFLAYEKSQYKVEDYNNVIRQVAAYFGLEVVDLYNDSGITVETLPTLTHDNVHPNALGMDAISEVFEKALNKKYNISD